MDSITAVVSYNSETGVCSYSPWYMGKDRWGGRMVGRNIIKQGFKVPSYLGIAYEAFEMDAVVMYPKPLHLIVRYWRKFRWGFLKFSYRIGLIDTGEYEAFSWSDFYRIKTH